MSRRQISFLLMGAVVLGGVAGCRCANEKRVSYVPPPPGVGGTCDRCATRGPMPPRFSPNTTPVVPGPPAPAVMAPPPGSLPAPPAQGAPPPGSAYPPPGAAIQQNGYNPPGPPTSSAPSGVAPSVYLEQPEPVAPEPAKPMPNNTAPPRETRPYTPQTPEPPPARDDHAASPALPVDIPQFAMVKPNIASGQEPFAEGVPWLKSHGYRTVLHIQAPGADDSAARRRFEQSGLRYLRLEVSPRTLSKDIVDQFNRLVADANNLPLFVYDKDSSLAGALWYLHFRLVDRATDEKAREDAEHLGFKKDRGDAHLNMWLAVQN
ncbi:MAG: fused DSP-PTPase phosphatase/NAD kinase-like protein, partial [Gemmataceae bacterium]